MENQQKQQILVSFLQDRSGNVAILFAFSVFVLVFAMGMGLDYVSAARKKSKLSAIADAAVLAAVTPTMMSQSPAQAQAAAKAMFMAQAGTISGLNLGTVTVTVTDQPTVNGTTRNVSISYSGSSANTFPSLLAPSLQGKNSIAIGNASLTNAATASTAPNTDFYLMLDTSPSMAIAATTAGIDTMVANTPKQNGCAFACHQLNPAGDNLGNPIVNGKMIDNFQLARNLGVTLRIDLVNQATQSVIGTAQTTEANNNAKYRMAVYDFDYTFRNVAPLTSNLTLAQAQASTIQLLEVYKNSYLTSHNNNNDTDTNFDNAMNSINAAMSNPGGGTNNPGDTPQETLFIVTDGVTDESSFGSRKIAAMGGNWCDTIKGRGIQIAILYTTYNPLPTNAFYNVNIAPFQPNIATTLQSCATPGLYTEVNTNGDIAAALTKLFFSALRSAHLTQ